MATITPSRVATPLDGQIEVWKWASFAGADTLLPVICPIKSDKSLQITVGTFGTTTFSIVGSNDPAGSVFGVCSDPDGTALSGIAAVGIKQILEACYLVNLLPSGGSGTGFTAFLLIAGR